MSRDYGASIWFVTAEAFDAEPAAFTMGRPAHWRHLSRDEDGDDERQAPQGN